MLIFLISLIPLVCVFLFQSISCSFSLSPAVILCFVKCGSLFKTTAAERNPFWSATEQKMHSHHCFVGKKIHFKLTLQACVIFTQHCCYRMSCNASVARLPFLVICYENESASVQSSLSYINVWISAPSAHLSSQVFEKLSCFSSFFCQSSLSVLEYKKKKKKKIMETFDACLQFLYSKSKEAHTHCTPDCAHILSSPYCHADSQTHMWDK